jgi:hypothetical protein
MSKDTGGPAFPTLGEVGETADVELLGKGMTLRDYFAASAMQGMLAENGGGAFCNAELAHFAYNLADEMLAEREK